jgi:hypothetical protein
MGRAVPGKARERVGNIGLGRLPNSDVTIRIVPNFTITAEEESRSAQDGKQITSSSWPTWVVVLKD